MIFCVFCSCEGSGHSSLVDGTWPLPAQGSPVFNLWHFQMVLKLEGAGKDPGGLSAVRHTLLI